MAHSSPFSGESGTATSDDLSPPGPAFSPLYQQIKLLMLESLLLAVLGGLLGLVVFPLGFGGFKAALMTTPMAGFAAGMRVYPSVLAVGFGISVFIGLFAGIVPAVGAGRRTITDGLRRVT